MGQLTDAIPRVVGSIDDRVALPRDAGEILANFREPLPDEGCGAAETIERLLDPE